LILRQAAERRVVIGPTRPTIEDILADIDDFDGAWKPLGGLGGY
jgi:hypothetical protein